MPAAREKAPKSKPPEDVVTSGRIFHNGVIDLVTSADPCRPNLIFYDGQRTQIAPRILHDGTWYCGPVLDPSIASVLTLPQDIAPSDPLVELFEDAAELLQGWLSLPPETAQQIALFEATTWLSDVLLNPPAVMMLGHRMAQAVRLFQFMRYGCRRAITLTGLNRASLVGLPMDLRPALLINQPGLSGNLSHLLSAANHQGMRVPGRRGAVLDWVGSRAMFLGSLAGPRSWTGEALWISLPPVAVGQLLPDERLAGKAQTLQDRFLRFRMDWVMQTRETGYSENDAPSQLLDSGLAQTLFACVRYEPQLIKATTPLLLGLVEEAKMSRRLDPDLVILEVVWLPGHRLREMAVVGITRALNKLLYERKGRYQYSEEEVGWRLKQLGFERVRGAPGRVVRFSDENFKLLHRLVRRAGLDFAGVLGCPLCAVPGQGEPE